MLARSARRSFAPVLFFAVAMGMALPVFADARDNGTALRPGVYSGKWHGDKVKIIVEEVCRNGTFSGIVHFDQASNWPDARFDFVGQIGEHGSITITRVKDGCPQVARTGAPCLEGRTLVWHGDVSEANLDRPYPFELSVPLNR